MAAKTIYLVRRSKGLCGQCGLVETSDNAARCTSCVDRRKTTMLALRTRRYSEGRCRECPAFAAPDRKMCLSCLAEATQKVTNQYRRLRQQVFDKYGNKCMCCGDTRSKYFQLDHINNDGKQDREKNPLLRGSRFYKALHKLPVRSDIQILCANCHHAKSFGDGCVAEDHALAA